MPQCVARLGLLLCVYWFINLAPFVLFFRWYKSIIYKSKTTQYKDCEATIWFWQWHTSVCSVGLHHSGLQAYTQSTIFQHRLHSNFTTFFNNNLQQLPIKHSRCAEASLLNWHICAFVVNGDFQGFTSGETRPLPSAQRLGAGSQAQGRAKNPIEGDRLNSDNLHLAPFHLD